MRTSTFSDKAAQLLFGQDIVDNFKPFKSKPIQEEKSDRTVEMLLLDKISGLNVNIEINLN